MGRNTFKSYVMDSIFGQILAPEQPAPKSLDFGYYNVYQVKKHSMFNVMHMFKVYHAISSGDHHWTIFKGTVFNVMDLHEKYCYKQLHFRWVCMYPAHMISGNAMYSRTSLQRTPMGPGLSVRWSGVRSFTGVEAGAFAECSSDTETFSLGGGTPIHKGKHAWVCVISQQSYSL